MTHQKRKLPCRARGEPGMRRAPLGLALTVLVALTSPQLARASR